MLAPSEQTVKSPWELIPRFDPLSVTRLRWLIKPFVAERNIQLVYGERGSFKSTLFLFAAKAVANGNLFLSMKTRRRRVLYLDYENPANIIKARNADLELNLPSNENLVIWDRFGNQPPRPDDILLEDIIRSCIEETGHGPWIIFDSWSSLLKIGEGGEVTGQTAPLYLQLRKLADAGATITVLDHSRKYERGVIYGGQDKEAKVDSIHNLLTYENKARPQNTIVRVDSWLKRHAPKGEGSFAFEVVSTLDKKDNWHIVDIIVTADPEVVERQQRIDTLRRLIKLHPNASQQELAKLAALEGLPRDQAIKLLQEETGSRWTVRRGSNNRFLYSLK